MSNYDVQQVCLSGHQITSAYESCRNNARDYCPKCGSKTITTCPNCGAIIPGKRRGSHVISCRAVTVPNHCGNCGRPFPWTAIKRGLEKAASHLAESDPIRLLESTLTRFPLVVRQLRKRHNNRQALDIKDEYDVQDLLRAMLQIHFDDIRVEEWAPSYAGACSRMEFLLKGKSIVIEIKMARNGLTAKEVGEQLIIDIERYKAHPCCRTLICFIYDPEGLIVNPAGLENDLSRIEDKLRVKVIIVPTGC